MDEPKALLEAAFSKVRTRLNIPAAFPPDVLRAAASVTSRDPTRDPDAAPRVDCRFLPFVTVDPPESLDLDQAFYAEPMGDGYAVAYAIADVSQFVDRTGPIEAEAWQRGATLYSPDLQTPLYPPLLSQGVASLLAGVDRPAVLFSLSLDEEARARILSVERVVIRSRAKLSYEEVSTHLSAERDRPGSGQFASRRWAHSLALLEAIGRKRARLAVTRGAVSLPIAAQHVQHWDAALHGYRLAFRNPNEVEGWNAEISLMTGMAAADLMCRRGVGLLRALDPPRSDKVEALRLTAAALGVAWPEGADYAAFIRSLEPTNPVHAAVIYHATGAMGGARYVSFVGDPPDSARHAAIASYYAHVTAPLRRLADRYVLDLLVDLSAGRLPSAEEASVLALLPPVMGGSDRLAHTVDAAMVDVAEALLLAGRVGETFRALVVRVRGERVTVQITDPPVRADIPISHFENGTTLKLEPNGAALRVGDRQIALGQWLDVRLTAADPQTGRIAFHPLETG